jgi:hypothetical membrane protein
MDITKIKNKKMLYIFIVSTLFLTVINHYHEIPKLYKYIYYSLYIVMVVTFLIMEILRAVKVK